MKIGITFDPPNQKIDIFGNGIKQNALFLYQLLKNCGFQISLIIAPGKWELRNNIIHLFNEEVDFQPYEEIEQFDLIFQITFQIPKDKIIKLKESGKKIILYCCGNEYTVILERTLFGGVQRFEIQYSEIQLFDEVWTIPQHVNTNLHYWKLLFRCPVREVPFIWSPTIIEKMEEKLDFNWKKREGKSIAIFEPNIGVVKWFFPALLVCEASYRIEKNIDHVYLTNLANKQEPFNIKLANELVKSLDIFRDRKVSIEGRYNTLQFMSKYSDIAVSHQWENGLNYLYLDLAWWGWPIIHNGHHCKDIGYYYDGFNYEEGGKILNWVINNHDVVAEEYKERNRKLIERYLPNNPEMIETYKQLVNSFL
jgi:hypothetical protein